ncbi:MAG: BBE domain-containing protein, partial [Chloroflexota bacterium]|nr:BBE domain-containing protein [Chloroflexota bacterium]
RRGQPAVARVMAVVDSDQPDVIIDRLQPVADVAPMYDQSVVITSYASIMANAQGRGDHDGQGEPSARSGLIEHITPEFAAAAARLIQSGAVYLSQIRSVGGAVSDVDPDATAYGNRSANFSVTAFGANRERLNTAWDEVYEYLDGLYLSFETDLRSERLGDAFPPRTIERLRGLKSRYDPDNVFRDNFNIAPRAPTGHGLDLSAQRSLR